MKGEKEITRPECNEGNKVASLRKCLGFSFPSFIHRKKIVSDKDKFYLYQSFHRDGLDFLSVKLSGNVNLFVPSCA